MTTSMTVKNHASSNGDISFTRRAPTHITRTVIAPGEQLTSPVSGNEDIEITELWPQRSPPAGAIAAQGEFVDNAIAKEAHAQIMMWGTDRPDNKNDELLAAAATSVAAIFYARTSEQDRAGCFAEAKAAFYPASWSPDAFRDYGSDFANLAVAAAFIRNQMLEMLSKGEDTQRSRRGEPYVSAKPFMSADQALSRLSAPRFGG